MSTTRQKRKIRQTERPTNIWIVEEERATVASRTGGTEYEAFFVVAPAETSIVPFPFGSASTDQRLRRAQIKNLPSSPPRLLPLDTVADAGDAREADGARAERHEEGACTHFRHMLALQAGTGIPMQTPRRHQAERTRLASE